MVFQRLFFYGHDRIQPLEDKTMYAIDLMMNEHIQIRDMLEVMRAMAKQLKEGKDVPIEDFEITVDFARNYGDKHHHMKEEDILFPELMDQVWMTMDIIQGVMLPEHQEGRDHISRLADALEQCKEQVSEEAVSQAIFEIDAYTMLLKEHTEKEDQVLYQIALMHLPKESKEKVDHLCKVKEEKEPVDNYLQMLESLKAKYL